MRVLLWNDRSRKWENSDIRSGRYVLSKTTNVYQFKDQLAGYRGVTQSELTLNQEYLLQFISDDDRKNLNIAQVLGMLVYEDDTSPRYFLINYQDTDLNTNNEICNRRIFWIHPFVLINSTVLYLDEFRFRGENRSYFAPNSKDEITGKFSNKIEKLVKEAVYFSEDYLDLMKLSFHENLSIVYSIGKYNTLCTTISKQYNMPLLIKDIPIGEKVYTKEATIIMLFLSRLKLVQLYLEQSNGRFNGKY